ncbi:hypothetical protein [Sphingopyxis sp.]|uniref:hypothetical protein n=1 Tax=Sphingopyxis sp. TaxID=1908224 RepID=UPI0035AE323F
MTATVLPAARWWHAALLIGFGAILVGLWLGQTLPQDSFAAEPGYGAPVFAFEFAGGQDDLIAVFGPDSDPRQVGRLAAMRTGNERDYLYILLYAGFLGCGLVALGRETGLRPVLAAAALPLLAALCDAYENWLLFDIQTAFTAGDYSPAMASLPYPVAAKFVLLALTNVAIGLALAQLGGRWWTLAGTLVIVACVPALMAIAVPSHYGWTLLAATGGGWIALLGTAAIASWRALVRKQPLVEIEPVARRPRPAATASVPPRPTFGRRRS